MKALPYGISDFPRIMRKNYYYVDKSRYIEMIERQPSYLFLIRPRRFGKSLFLAMLETYYSIDYADSFEEIFGELYIGKHPTEEHNKYMVLRFNFSAISSKLEDVERSFCEYCCMVMKNFILKYEHLLGSDIWKVVNPDETNPRQMLSALKEYVSRTDCPRIYLLIDEYDNFTNTILSSYGQERYREKTHGEGFIRGFFNNIKDSTSNAGAAVERLFITGVSPITMDDVTSGFNIGTNISMMPQFNDIIGFSEDEVREMITYYKDENALPEDVTVDRLVELMKPWYDNYCFSEDSLEERMFNSDMTLYFLNSYLQLKKVPKMMVDNNIRTDYNKLRHLVQIDKTFGVNASVIQRIIALGFRIFVVVRISPSEGSMKEISFVWVSTFTSSSFPTYPHGTLYRTLPNRIWLLGRTFLLITLLCAEYSISGSGRSRFLSSALYRLNRLLPGRSVSSALLSWASNGSIALFISSMLKKLRLLR